MFRSTFLHEKVNYGRFYEYGYACNVSENYQRCLYEDYHQSCQHLINTCLNSPRYRCWSTQMLMIDISTLLNWLKIYNSVDKIVCPRGRGRFSPMNSPRILQRNVVISVRKFRLDRSGPRWCDTFFSPLLFWCVSVGVGGDTIIWIKCHQLLQFLKFSSLWHRWPYPILTNV